MLFNFLFIFCTIFCQEETEYNPPKQPTEAEETAFIKKVKEALNSQPPKPTDEIKNLISQLGSDLYENRKDADEKLRKLGYEAITAIEEGLKSKDAEIRYRCQLILNSFYAINLDEYSYVYSYVYGDQLLLTYGIYVLHPEIRKENDISKIYFDEARKLTAQIYEYKERTKPWHSLKVWVMIKDDVYRDVSIENLGMVYLIHDLLHGGMSKEEIISLLNYQRIWSDRYYRQSLYQNGSDDNWTKTIPLPKKL